MRSLSLRRLAPALAGIGATSALVAIEPSLLLSTIRSPRATAAVLASVIVTVLAGRLAGQRLGPVAGWAARAVPIGLVAWLAVLPALRTTTLDEPLSVVAAGSGRAATAPSAPVTVLPEAEQAPPPAGTTEAGQDPPPTTSRPPRGTPTTAQPRIATAPVVVSSGRFEGIGHHATGDVSVVRLADGSHIVRFDDIELRGSPDPVLYVVPGRSRDSRDGGREIADLKATKGSFNHPLPADVDLSGDYTVFIWCDAFATPIAKAAQDRA